MSSDIVSQINAVLQIPLPEVVNERHWHNNALTLFETDSELPGRLLDAAKGILQSIPDLELAANIEKCRDSCDAMSVVRNTRKLVMIGRDTLLLCSSEDLGQSFDPLFTLARSLGHIADTNGRKKHWRHLALNSLALLSTIDMLNQKTAASADLLKQKVGIMLSSTTLINRDLIESEATFHTARKNFRRVVHLGVASCVDYSDPDKLHFIASGLWLNKFYGSYHDSLLESA